jgi:hypothetical protein
MSTTRLEVLRLAIAMCPERGLSTIDDENNLVASAGAVGSLTDLGVLPQTGASTALFNNAYLYRPKAANAEDIVRQIGATGYAGTTQVITHEGPNYTEAPLGGSDDGTYLITKDHPFLWETALNRALKTLLFYRREEEFTPTTSGQRQYTLSTSPLDGNFTLVTSPAQIHNVQYRGKSDTSGQYEWRDWFQKGRRQWRVYQVNNTVALEFIPPGPAPTTDDRLRLVIVVPQTAVTTHNQSITLTNPTWAAAATVLMMARSLANRNNPDDIWLKYARDAEKIYNDLRRQELGELAYRSYGRSNTRSGGASVGGRAGRGGRHLGATLGGRI